VYLKIKNEPLLLVGPASSPSKLEMGYTLLNNLHQCSA